MIRRLLTLVIVFLIGALALPTAIHAQGGGGADDCPAFVEDALDAVGDACTGLDRNEACYGFNRVDATFWQARDDLVFSAPADRVPLADLQTIATAPLSTAREEWGIAALHVQANVPDALPGQAVTFLLMGDATLENAVPPEALAWEVTVEAITVDAADLYSSPQPEANVLAALEPDTALTLVGVDEIGGWFEALTGEYSTAWVQAEAVEAAEEADLEALPVTFGEGIPPRYGPMQAIYLSTGFGGTTCHDAPDTLLVESPEGIEVALNVNALDVRIGSVARFATAPTGDGGAALVAVLLDGHLRLVGERGDLVLDQPGAAVAITLNDDGLVDGESDLLDPVPLLEAAGIDILPPDLCDGLASSDLLARDIDPELCSAPPIFAPVPVGPDGVMPPDGPVPPEGPMPPDGPVPPDGPMPPDGPVPPDGPMPPDGPPPDGGCFWPSITTMNIPGDVNQTITFNAVPGAAAYTWHVSGSGYSASGQVSGTSFTLDVSGFQPGSTYQMWVEPLGPDGGLLCDGGNAPPAVNIHAPDTPPDGPPPPPPPEGG